MFFSSYIGVWVFLFFLDLWQVELVVLLEDLLDRVHLKKLRSATRTDIAAQIGYFVVELHQTFLPKHAHGGQEQPF